MEFLQSIYRFLENIGRARAASECRRLGRYDLANNIIADVQ